MLQVIKPPALEKGEIIGIVATSFPFPNPADESNSYYREYKKGVKVIENMGFRTKEAKNIRKTKWWFAGTPKERASDINDMFADPEVKAIIVHDGGTSSISTLELINYEIVRKHPKPFIGFSDITNIHSALFSQVGLVGFHGPLLTYSLGRVWEQFLPNKREEGKKLLFDALTSTSTIGKRIALTKWESWHEGKAEGQLFGGNISILASLIGSKYFPKLNNLKGSILFWEIDNVPSYRIEKALYQFKYAGIIDVISGMLIGKLPDIKKTVWSGLIEPTPKEIIMEILKGYNFPIIGEMDFGHKTVDFPMPIGLKAKINADRLSFEILESAVI